MGPFWTSAIWWQCGFFPPDILQRREKSDVTGYTTPMNAEDKDRKPASGGNIFEDDDLDAAVGAADDTGMVSAQQVVVHTEIDEDLKPRD